MTKRKKNGKYRFSDSACEKAYKKLYVFHGVKK